MIKLFKKNFFINDFIYTTSTDAGNFVSQDLIDILSSFNKDTDLICDSETLIDILNLLTLKHAYIETNADFNFPLPKDLIKDDTILIAKGLFTEGDETFNLITQIAFKFNNHNIRMGVLMQ